jgi:hypothetical protein
VKKGVSCNMLWMWNSVAMLYLDAASNLFMFNTDNEWRTAYPGGYTELEECPYSMSYDPSVMCRPFTSSDGRTKRRFGDWSVECHEENELRITNTDKVC